MAQQRWPDIDHSELITAAINGLIDGLDDPAAAFLNAERYPAAKEAINESLEGTYLGIGAQVITRDNKVLLYPFRDSPAEKAGIEPGDSLLEVQGEDHSRQKLGRGG